MFSVCGLLNMMVEGHPPHPIRANLLTLLPGPALKGNVKKLEKKKRARAEAGGGEEEVAVAAEEEEATYEWEGAMVEVEDTHEYYAADSIVAEQVGMKNGTSLQYYRVRYTGYGPAHDSWVTEEHISTDILVEWRELHPTSKKRRR